MKKIAAINDLSGLGRCSLTANIPIISAMGAQCCPLPTGVLSNQTGYPQYVHHDLSDKMPSIATQWQRMGLHFDGILVGFVSSAEQAGMISDFITTFADSGTVVLVDPIMGDDGGIYSGFTPERIDAICRLTDRATIITPNLTELCIITGNEYYRLMDMDDQQRLDSIGVMAASMGKAVVVTGVALSNDRIANVIYSPDDGVSIVKCDKLGGSFSGTGDIMASILIVTMVNGGSIRSAIELATDFITQSIRHTLRNADAGYIPADGIYFEQQLSLLTRRYDEQ